MRYVLGACRARSLAVPAAVPFAPALAVAPLVVVTMSIVVASWPA
ncbi:hypothetical protein [Rhizomonospora bruguierae]|nr:hypothetical protein [Micromonospora sp. NBRC 107566]